MNSLILTGMVSALCSGTMLPEHKPACSSAVEATVRQSGIYEDVKLWERRQLEKTKNTAQKTIGVRESETIVTIFLLTGVAMGNNAMIKLGKGPGDGNYFIETNARDFKLGVGWDF